MRQFPGCAVGLVVVWCAVVYTQTVNVTNLEEHDKAMKAIGTAFGATNKAVASGSMADAKAALGTVRSNMVAVQAFWDMHKKADQARFANDIVAKIDQTDDLLTDNDASAADATLKQIQTQCGGCHKATRDPDPNNPKLFVVKPGLL